MSTKLNQVIKEYLDKEMVVEATTGGDGDEETSTGINNDKMFSGRLKSFLRLNKNLIITVYTVIIAVVIFLGVLIWFQRDNLGFVLGLLGGQGAGIYFGINKMQTIFKENFVARMILDMLPHVSTSQEKDKLMEMMKTFLENK